MSNQLIEVRIPANLAEELKNGVQFKNGHESVVFGLASSAKLQNRTLLLLKRVYLVPENEYIDSPNHGAVWSGAAMLLIINEAMEKNLGIVMFHEHGGSGKVGLSTDDKKSAAVCQGYLDNFN